MQKVLIGLALLTPLTALVHAQSSVSITGTVDGAVRDQTNASASGGSKLSSNSNGYYSSNKLDFIGNEDLGNDNHVKFLLESGFNLGNGQLDNTTNTLFNRQAYVQIDGAAGALSLGRQYTISHGMIQVFDPFSFHFTPLIPLTRASDGTRLNNDVKYAKSFGPIKVEVENAFGEVAGNNHSGASRGVGIMYDAGGLAFGVEANRASTLVGTTYHNDNYYLIGGSYTVGQWKISGGAMTEAVINVVPLPDTKTHNSFGGVSYSMSPVLTLTGGYYLTSAQTDKAQRSGLSIFALTYSLSKRTTVYVEADYTHFGHVVVSTINPIGVQHQTGLTTGIDHRF